MKNNILRTLIFLLAITGLVSCHCKQKVSGKTVPIETTRDFPAEGYVKATVIHYELDGCGYLLQLEDGKKLEPDALPESFRKENTLVWIKYEIRKGATSICMAGIMVTVADIQIRK